MAYDVWIERIVTQPEKRLVQAVGRNALLHDGKSRRSRVTLRERRT